MRFVEGVVAVGLLVVLLCGASKRNARRDSRPADNRQHVSEAVVYLEEARSSLCEAERIILGVGSCFLVGLPDISGNPDSQGRPICHHENPPNFEDAFHHLEVGLMLQMDFHVDSVVAVDRWIQQVAPKSRIRHAGIGTYDDHRDLITRLLSTIRTFPLGKNWTDVPSVDHPPNIFAERDANFVDLPVRRFWNMTHVPMDDLDDAISVTSGQIAASRAMLTQLDADRRVLRDVFQRALNLSVPSQKLMEALLTDDRLRWPPTTNMTTVRQHCLALDINVAQWQLFLYDIIEVADLFMDAFDRLDDADRNVEESRYLAGLDSLLRDEPASDKPRRRKKKPSKRKRLAAQVKTIRETSANPSTSLDGQEAQARVTDGPGTTTVDTLSGHSPVEQLGMQAATPADDVNVSGHVADNADGNVAESLAHAVADACDLHCARKRFEHVDQDGEGGNDVASVRNDVGAGLLQQEEGTPSTAASDDDEKRTRPALPPTEMLSASDNAYVTSDDSVIASDDSAIGSMTSSTPSGAGLLQQEEGTPSTAASDDDEKRTRPALPPTEMLSASDNAYATSDDSVIASDDSAFGSMTSSTPSLPLVDSVTSDASSGIDVSPSVYPGIGLDGIPPGIEEFLEPPSLGGAYLEADLDRFLTWAHVWRHRDSPVRQMARDQVERIVQSMFPGSVVRPMLLPADGMYLQAPYTGLDFTVCNPALRGSTVRCLKALRASMTHGASVFLPGAVMMVPFPRLIVQIRGSPLLVALSMNTFMPTRFALQASIKYPMMKPVLFYVWFYLVRHGLHDPVQGGIDWHLLQVMVVSHLQVNADQCQAQGRCLRSFFAYYGAQFNYHRDCLSVTGDGRVFPKAERGYLVDERAEFRLCAESPYDPKIDIGLAAFNIRAVVDRFRVASDKFRDYFPGQLLSPEMVG
ncbi:hypothetical protein PBRA_000404 [Plasmodiophora brassicae]|nr:hypothetical protein PBRA_000404 [Plasmodiophora brassicae]